MADHNFDISADVIIIGGGFSGIIALHKLRGLGFSAKLLDAGTDFGGVWQLNRYPGCRVDSDTPLYQLSFPKVYDGFNFSERFPRDTELRTYFSHVDKTLELRKDAIFGTTVCEVKFDTATKKWMTRSKNGLLTSSTYVVFACGTLNKPYIPDYPGLQEFAGQVIHSSAWPRDLDLRGKKVGLIGQGATGIQIVQDLAEKNVDLTVFVRTPSILIPMQQHAIPEVASEGLKPLYDGLFHTAKYVNQAGFAYNKAAGLWKEASEQERRDVFEREWRRGGFNVLTSSFADLQFNDEANEGFYEFWKSKVHARMTDKDKAFILAPTKRPKFVGSNRPSLEQHYYESMDRTNVKLVDLKATPIATFMSHGVETTDGRHRELDVVICATGYDGVTGSLLDLAIHDKNGMKLQEKWRDGVTSYLGMMVPDLPNAFMLFGPQAPTSLTNAPPFIELQVEWIVDLLEKARQDKVELLEPTAEAAAGWKAIVTGVYTGSCFAKNDSWWVGANIPGKRREPLVFSGGIRFWWQRCADALLDWSNFETTRV